ncbi:MAG TPA: hypothetical protein VH142_24435 [Polyangiaceae bacterium]|jgi:hypothetical protein|nr:hypothetical protein [Polyangiaceae bacterium]
MPKASKASASFEDRHLNATRETALAAVLETGARSEDLVAAWLDGKNVEAVAEVAEHAGGAARKAARRALNVFGARGIAAPARAHVTVLTTSAKPDVVEGWMMAPDSSGMQMFAVTARPAAARYRSSFVFLHALQGVARVDNGTMSQTQLDEYFAKVLPGAGYGATKVPVEWARFRIAEARRAHRERGLPEPLGFTTASPLLEPVPAEAPSHPFDDEGLELSDEDALDLAKGSATLHNLPEFRSWLPTSAALQELLINVGTKLTPGKEPEAGAVAEHLRAEVDLATDRFFSEDVRNEVLRRMKDSALSIFAREGEQRALEVAAAMKVIEKCGILTNPPRDVPFLKAFFDKGVAMMVAQGGGRLRIPVPSASMPESAPTETSEAQASPSEST